MSDHTPYECGSTLRATAVAGLVTLASFSSGCAWMRHDKIHHVVNPTEQPAARLFPAVALPLPIF